MKTRDINSKWKTLINYVENCSERSDDENQKNVILNLNLLKKKNTFFNLA